MCEKAMCEKAMCEKAMCEKAMCEKVPLQKGVNTLLHILLCQRHFACQLS